MDLYIAPDGRDQWTGLLPEPNADKTDGPLASLAGAQRLLRRLAASPERVNPRWASHPRRLNGPVTVHLRGGRYELTQPLTFTTEDTYPITFKAFRDEKPILDGGRRIENFREETADGRRRWIADLPEVAAGQWAFRSLFVNGRRALRPRLPKAGLFRMKEVPGMPLPTGWGEGGYTRFVAAEGDVRAFHNLPEVDVVYVHFWIEERSPIESFDPQRNLVTMSRPSRAPLVGSHGSQLADYYLDNVFEALTEPGEWYLDRPQGRLYYLPREGETLATAEVYAPAVLQLLAVTGEAESRRHASFLRFEGLTFRHTDWRHPGHDGALILGSSQQPEEGKVVPYPRRHCRGKLAGSAQGACDLPGVITFEAAGHCAIENCTLEHLGWYAIEIGDGCHGIRLVGNTLRDLGGGGIKISGAGALKPHLTTGHHRITDNQITQGGRIFHSAEGVLAMNAHSLVIAHNHIHDLYYTGISVGWVWGYQESVTRDVRIEKNHIHHIGQGLLSDMGGIYTLGVQPGTVIRGNLIHDIQAAHYGGWCIYPDEGSSHLVIENNICYDADRNAFHQHYGRENTVRNNIWALGGEAQVAYSAPEAHRGFTFQRNIVVTDGKPIFTGGYGNLMPEQRIESDLNLFWDVRGEEVTMRGKRRDVAEVMGLETWREQTGLDHHSLVADPKFKDLAKRDFTLAEDSPALALGFKPMDLSDVGPRPIDQRE